MLRFRSYCCNGFQDHLFINGFRQLVLYSTSISTQLNPKFANYLVENLGFSKQQALSTSSKLINYRLAHGSKEVSNFDFANNADSVIEFLNKIGLQQSHIRTAVVINPRILLSSIDKNLKPKTEIFQKLGFSESDIADVLTANPCLFYTRSETSIVPAIQILRETLGCESNQVISILKKLRRNNISCIPKYLVQNVAFLRSYEIPINSIQKFLCRKPSTLVRNTDVLRNAVVTVEKKLGIPRSSLQFMRGVEIINSNTEKCIESKMKIYKSFGWNDSDIVVLVSSQPSVLALSEGNIKKKLDFFMNELGNKPSYLASKGLMLTYSLEKRVVPRHKVLVVLKENGLIRKEYALASALVYNESIFLEKFVLPFKEVHEVYSKYAGISLENLTLGSPKPNSTSI